MKTKKIDINIDENENIKTGLFFKECTITKVEKLQEFKSRTSVIDATQAYMEHSTTTKTTVYLDTNEYFTLREDANILEGWHIRETYVIFNGKTFYHNSFCPETHTIVLGSKEPVFNRLRFLRWHFLNADTIQKLCKQNEKRENSLQLPSIEPKLLFKIRASMVFLISIIIFVVGYKLLWRGIVDYNANGFISFLFLNIAFFFGALFAASALSMLINWGLATALNVPRQKAYNRLIAKEFELPESYNEVKEIMNSNYDTFTKNGIDGIEQ
ncbi:MAG: hypothetical protein IJ191_05275 [Treponema sp.]|nr:hypothetical protein [Treponema sp.]